MASGIPSSLAGKRILVTRALEQSDDLCREITARGGEARIVPLVSFALPEDPAPLDAALRDPANFDWLFLTSQNAVRALSGRCDLLGVSLPQAVGSLRIAAVGAPTADAAQQAGLRVAYVAKTHRGVALAQELGAQLAGAKILLPRSDRANPDLPEALKSRSALVTEVVAYRTLLPAGAGDELLQEILRGKVDAILFFSPSAVHHFAEVAGAARMRELQSHLTYAAIGPVTAVSLAGLGIDPMVVSPDATVSGILDALAEHWAHAAHLGARGA